jgi:PAS domain S-box-containing protein/diguanylate cyclase (GGDEF)-like protein
VTKLAQQIQILLVEDDLKDAQMVMAEVNRGVIAASFTHVAERRGALAALDQGGWDLILSDFSLPDMTALDLLGWVRERRLDVPVIVVTGTIGEELAVLTMHAGARDFITKRLLARLNPAIERELQEQDIHRQRWLAEAALVESEQNFRQLTETIPEVFWLIDCERQQMIYLSPAFESVWEQPAASFMSRPERLLETVHPEDHDRVRQQMKGVGWQGLNLEYRIVLPDDSVRWIDTRSFPILDEAGRVIRITGLSTDISGRKRLEVEREMMSRALAQTADAVMITDAEGVIVFVNSAFKDLTGYDSGDVIGKTPKILKSGFQDENFYQTMWSNIGSGMPHTEIFINRRKDGELYYEAKTITPIRDTEGVVIHYVSTSKDITDRLKTKERLNKIVNYDAITGLANRVLLQERLGQALLHGKRQQLDFGLLSVGLELNELLDKRRDNRVMEKLLREVAKRLKSCVAGQDTVARMSSGEFVILHKDHGHVREQLETMAKEVVIAFSAPVTTEGYELFLRPSIGISLFPADAEAVEPLLLHAKIAMEHARKVGHGSYSFFQGEMLVRAKQLSS